MAFNRRLSFNTAVQEVMGSLGLLVPANVAASMEKNVVQFRSLADMVGEKLLNAAAWQVLDGEMTIVTDGVTLEYPLPDDWDHFVQDASWNRTTRLPALGSLTEVEWSQLKARNLGGTTFAVLFTIQNDRLVFYSVGATPQTIVLPYVSRGWVLDAAVRKDRLTNNDDIILYDPVLFKSALKLAWQIEKGFDTRAAEQGYRAALSAATSKQAPARTLSLGGGGYPYLSELNIPVTGYGV